VMSHFNAVLKIIPSGGIQGITGTYYRNVQE